MRELLEQGLGAGIVGVMVGVGFFTRMILFFYYGTLGKACKNFEETNHKTIVYIREDLKQRAGKKQGIKSTMIYTECRLAECKVLGFRVGGVECVARQSLPAIALSGVLTALAGVLQNCDVKTVLRLLLVSGTAVGVLMLIDMFGGLQEKHKRIRVCIRDYIENTRTVAEEETEPTEELWKPEESGKKAHRKERKEEKKATKRERKEAKREQREKKKIRRADKPVKACKKKRGKAQEEKRRLTEELLRERRQLEARSLAEYRRKERGEESTAQQMQAEAEAAVTECAEAAEVTLTGGTEAANVGITENEETREAASNGCDGGTEVPAQTQTQGISYEALLSEVLAEYLA